jgi:hypothetical protein
MNAEQLIEFCRSARERGARPQGDIRKPAVLLSVLRTLLDMQLSALEFRAELEADRAGCTQDIRTGAIVPLKRPQKPDPRHDELARALATLIANVQELPDHAAAA